MEMLVLMNTHTTYTGASLLLERYLFLLFHRMQTITMNMTTTTRMNNMPITGPTVTPAISFASDKGDCVGGGGGFVGGGGGFVGGGGGFVGGGGGGRG